MSIEHKAYKFNWSAFDADLCPILIDALESNNQGLLLSYIDANIHDLTDPYTGKTLQENWRLQTENRDDIHEFGDFALTRFYDPLADSGVGAAWRKLDNTLPYQCLRAMLGQTVGPPNLPFDPGRMGSYFQSPACVMQSIDVLAAVDDSRLVDYLMLLRSCGSNDFGVYVTF